MYFALLFPDIYHIRLNANLVMYDASNIMIEKCVNKKESDDALVIKL
jgi:hypothetical protein